MKLSLRTKILTVLGVVSILGVGLYTILASYLLRQEKTRLLYDINHSVAVNTSAYLNSYFTKVIGEIKLYITARFHSHSSLLRLSRHNLAEARVLRVSLYERKGNKPLPLAESDPPSLSNDTVTEYLTALDRFDPMVFGRSTPEGPRFFLLNKVQLEQHSTRRIVYALSEMDPSHVFYIIQSANVFQSLLVRSDGTVLFHADENGAKETRPLPKSHPIVSFLARGRVASSGLLSFELDSRKWHSAYAPVGFGDLFFVAQADQQEIQSAIRVLLRRSLLFALVVLTVTFLTSVIVSKRTTKHIDALTHGVRAIGAGNLDQKVEIHSGDEIEEFARTLDNMRRSLKESREALERYNRELEDKVAERTEALEKTHAAIREMQDRLLHTSQLAVVGEVSGRTAHEVLNPLTALLNRLDRAKRLVGESTSQQLFDRFFEILCAWESDYKGGGFKLLAKNLMSPSKAIPKQNLFEEDVENLRRIGQYWKEMGGAMGEDITFVQQQAGRIHRTVEGMRALTRSSSERALHHCHELVKEAVRSVSDLILKEGIQIETKFVAESDSAVMNSDEFIQIIVNLLRNGHQAIVAGSARSSDKGGRIEIQTSNERFYLCVDITDNGIGVPPEKQPQLFSQGFTTKPPSEGTGLGLAICQRYAHAFGGDVKLMHSEPDKATCFRIMVPLAPKGETQIAA